MPITALSAADGFADVGDTWRVWLMVVDYDGFGVVPDSIAATVTKPDTTTAAATVTADTTTGLYRVTYDLTAAGKYQLAITVTDADVDDDVARFEVLAQAAGTFPTLSAVKTYIGETSWSDSDIQDALDAETLAQRARCRIPVTYPADLAQALKRRVRRNLEARGVALSSTTSFDEGANVTKRVPWIDPEIRRFEGPYRRRCVG